MLDEFNDEQFEEVSNLTASDFQLSADEALIEVDPQYFRPTEVEFLLGDAEKAKQNIGWEPEYAVNELVEDMVEGDFEKFAGTTH